MGKVIEKIIAVCKNSYVIIACGFDWVEIWSGLAKSLANRVIIGSVFYIMLTL